MNSPSIYTADHLRDWGVSKELKNGRWVYARPLGYQGLCLRQRLKLAWGVFTGRYDALYWINQERP